MESERKKEIIEALLFASERPLGLAEIEEVLDETNADSIKELIAKLNQEYQATGRSFKISEVAGGFQLATEPEYSPWLKKLYKSRLREKLTRPSLETMAIVAYRQPVTKPDIEGIRGVNVDGVVSTLLDRGLIKILGRKETVGRPLIYGTTRQFLEHFGLGSLNDLPKPEEFSRVEDMAQELTQRESQNRPTEVIQERDLEKEGIEDDPNRNT